MAISEYSIGVYKGLFKLNYYRLMLIISGYYINGY